MSVLGGLDRWLETALVLGLGGGALVLIAAVIERRLASGAWRRMVWQAAVIGLALLAALEVTGGGDAVVRLSGAWSVESGGKGEEREPRREEREAGEKTAAAVVLSEESSPTPEAVSWELPSSVAPMLLPEPEPPLALERATQPFAPPSSLLPPRSSPLPPPPSPLWPLAVWAAGATAVLGRLALGRVLLWRLTRTGAAVDAGRTARVTRLASRLGVRRARLVELPNIVSPIAFGVVRPTIGLPRDFESLPADQQDAVLAHELAHLAARDPAWQTATDVVVALWWWHPGAWLAARRLRASAELAADEASLLVSDGPAALAACLVELGRRLTRPRRLGWVAAEGSGLSSGLAKRVERLLRLEGRTRVRPRRWLHAMLCTAGVACVLSFALIGAAWARGPAEPQTGGPPMKTIASSWRQSLGAMALAAVLGGGPDTAVAYFPDEGASEQKEEKQSKQTDFQSLKQEIAKLREAGRLDEAAAREKELRGLVDKHWPDVSHLPEETQADLKEILAKWFELRDAGKYEDADALEKKAHALLEKHHPQEPAHGGETLDKLKQAINEARKAGRESEVKELEAELRKHAEHQLAELAQRHPDLAEKLRPLVEDYLNLRAKGSYDDADRVEAHIKEMEQEIAGYAKQHKPGKPDGDIDPKTRLHHLQAAAENLRAAGMHDAAEKVEAHAEELLRQLKDSSAREEEEEMHFATEQASKSDSEKDAGRGEMPAELVDILQSLRGEIERLRRDVNELRERVDGTGGDRPAEPTP